MPELEKQGSVAVPDGLTFEDIEVVAHWLALYSNGSAECEAADQALAAETGLGDDIHEWPPIQLAAHLVQFVCSRVRR